MGQNDKNLTTNCGVFEAVVCLLLTIFVVPIYFCLSWISEGRILFYFPGKKELWNIQYAFPLILSIVVSGASYFGYNRFEFKIDFAFSTIWNLIIAIALASTIVMLWGEKF